jgi:hypothetical protein
MTAIQHKMRIIGRREFVHLPLLGLVAIEAKIDTGAYTSSLHCENITVNYENSKPILYFTIEQNTEVSASSQTFRFEEFTTKKIKNSFGEMEERFVIKTFVHIGKKKIRSSISLSNRDSMRYPLLIGRRLIKGKFLVDVNSIHTGGIKISKALHLLT